MKTIQDGDTAPVDRVRDSARASRALRRAVRAALMAHQRDGDPVVVWEDGQVRWIPANEIVIPEPDQSEAD